MIDHLRHVEITFYQVVVVQLWQELLMAFLAVVFCLCSCLLYYATVVSVVVNCQGSLVWLVAYDWRSLREIHASNIWLLVLPLLRVVVVWTRSLKEHSLSTETEGVPATLVTSRSSGRCEVCYALLVRANRPTAAHSSSTDRRWLRETSGKP